MFYASNYEFILASSSGFWKRNELAIWWSGCCSAHLFVACLTNLTTYQGYSKDIGFNNFPSFWILFSPFVFPLQGTCFLPPYCFFFLWTSLILYLKLKICDMCLLCECGHYLNSRANRWSMHHMFETGELHVIYHRQHNSHIWRWIVEAIDFGFHDRLHPLFGLSCCF